MFVTIKKYLASFVYLAAATIALTGCGSKPFIVKPAENYVGNISIKSITVTKTDSVTSDTIVAAVKSRLEKDAAGLRGAKAVEMNVTLDYLTVPLPGGEMTAKMLGSKTELKGEIAIVEAGQIVAKYRINAEHNEGGLLGKMTTISFVDTQEAVVTQFSAFAVGYMQ